MNRLFQSAIYLIMGLWLGSLAGIFLAVTTLFNTRGLKKQDAGILASGIFDAFNRDRLILATVGVLLTFIWWLADRTKFKVALFGIFAAAITVAVVIVGFLTPQIETLRSFGETHSAHFSRLHGLSMALYLLEASLVFIGCALLPWASSDGNPKPE